MVEAFMSSWSSLVGDPVVSKWIVCFLAVSVALNGYLLKGIAATSGLSSVVPGVRFSATTQEKEVKEAKEEGVVVKQVENTDERLTAIRKKHVPLSEVQADMKHFTFKVVDKGGKPYIEVEYRGETKQFVSLRFFPDFHDLFV